MSKEVERFISKFCNWGYQQGCSKRLPELLRQVINKKLPTWDNHLYVHIRGLTNSQDLICSIISENVWCGRSSNKYFFPENCLLTGVFFPYWREGISDISLDDYTLNMVETFLHFSSQYVARSRVLDIIGPIALTYNKG